MCHLNSSQALGNANFKTCLDWTTFPSSATASSLPTPRCIFFCQICVLLSSMWEILFRFQADLRPALNPTQDASIHPRHPPDKPTFKVKGENLFQFREGFIGKNLIHFFVSLWILHCYKWGGEINVHFIRKMGKSKSKYFTLYPFAAGPFVQAVCHSVCVLRLLHAGAKTLSINFPKQISVQPALINIWAQI